MEFDKIPNKLKSLHDWLTWHYETDSKGKIKKAPTVSKGWTQNTLLTFDEVIPVFKQQQAIGKANGIGIRFTENNNLVGIDIDHVSDSDISTSSFLSGIVLSAKNAYLERSVSGNGFHIIGYCSNKKLLLELFKEYNGKTGARTCTVELYPINRYFTVTGNAIYANYGCIDASILLAWEQITGESFFNSVATLLKKSVSVNANKSVSDIAEKSVSDNASQSVATAESNGNELNADTSVATIPRPDNAYSDEEIAKLPLRPMKQIVKFMYQKRPILEKLLRTEGDAAAGEFWQEYGRTDSADRTPSGLDLAVTSKVVFWLYRYGKDAIVDFMKKSRLNRNKPTENYWELTVETALESAIEYFPATVFNLPKEEKEKLANWIAWKKEIANKKR